MWPMANAMVKTVNPKAKETPNNPIPTLVKAAASTALPQPPKTSQKVPIYSATSFLLRDIAAAPLVREYTPGGPHDPVLFITIVAMSLLLRFQLGPARVQKFHAGFGGLQLFVAD